MKNLLAGVLLFAVLGLASCGSDDCTAADWAGTYTLQGDAECMLDESTTIEFDQTFVVVAGATDSEITINGETATINSDDCSVTNFIRIVKDGNTLTADLGGGCIGEWSK